MAEEAWGRWGADDERGALNLISPDEVRRAVALVASGEVLSLAQTISTAMMIPPHRPRMAHFMGRDGGDYAGGARRPGGFQFAEDTVLLPLHLGTHIDCLCHSWYGDQLYNAFPGSSVRSSGATRCGAQTLGPIVTRGTSHCAARSASSCAGAFEFCASCTSFTICAWAESAPTLVAL